MLRESGQEVNLDRRDINFKLQKSDPTRKSEKNLLSLSVLRDVIVFSRG